MTIKLRAVEVDWQIPVYVIARKGFSGRGKGFVEMFIPFSTSIPTVCSPPAPLPTTRESACLRDMCRF